MILAIIIAIVVLGLLLGWFNAQAILTVLMLLPIALAVVFLVVSIIAFPREVSAGAVDAVGLINQYTPVVVSWLWYPALALVGLATVAALVPSARATSPSRRTALLATVFAGLAVTLMMVQMASLTVGPDASDLVSAMTGLISVAVLLQGPLLVAFVRTMTLTVIERQQRPMT
jgi:hypothetical protein